MEILRGQAHLRERLQSDGSPKDDADALRTYLNRELSHSSSNPDRDRVHNSDIALLRDIADRIERGYK